MVRIPPASSQSSSLLTFLSSFFPPFYYSPYFVTCTQYLKQKKILLKISSSIFKKSTPNIALTTLTPDIAPSSADCLLVVDKAFSRKTGRKRLVFLEKMKLTQPKTHPLAHDGFPTLQFLILGTDYCNHHHQSPNPALYCLLSTDQIDRNMSSRRTHCSDVYPSICMAYDQRLWPR